MTNNSSCPREPELQRHTHSACVDMLPNFPPPLRPQPQQQGFSSSWATSVTSADSSAQLHSPPMHRPPISFVVLKDSSESLHPSLSSSLSAGLRRVSKRAGSTQTRGCPSVGACRPLQMGSSPGQGSIGSFRLQPRRPLMCSPGVVSGRGRKRTAQSISAADFDDDDDDDDDRIESDKLNTSVHTEEETLSGSGVSGKPTPASPARRLDGALVTFQGLTILSPYAHGQSPQNRLATTPATTTMMMEGAPSPASFVGSQRSSFSRYNASPAGSASTSDSARQQIPRSSPITANSSPRFAPLKVLTSDDTSRVPVSCSKTLAPRPPRHCGMSAMFHRLEDERAECEKMEEQQLLSTPVNQGTCMPALNPKNTVTSELTMSTVRETPARQARRNSNNNNSHESPAKRQGISPRTPLPKISLTPRTTPARRSQDLPAFPSPDGGFILSFATRSSPPPQRAAGNVAKTERELPSLPGFFLSARESSASTGLSMDADMNSPLTNKKKPDSFIPVPDWAADDRQLPMLPSSITTFSQKSGSGSNGAGAERRTLPGSTLIRSQSLWAPPKGRDEIDALMEATEVACMMDNDSLCDSDDEDVFLLASPGAIAEEKQARRSSVKQRKMCRVSSTATSSGHLSNCSLKGMDFVLSNPNLNSLENNQGMPSFPKLSFTALKRDDSSGSIGLALDNSQIHTYENSSGYEHSPDRDLVTPPVTSQARLSPPPLQLQSPHVDHLQNVYSAPSPPGVEDRFGCSGRFHVALTACQKGSA